MALKYRTAAALSADERDRLRVAPDDKVLIHETDAGSKMLSVRPLGLAPELDFDVEPAQRWAAARAGRVDALVVFGSRARGTAHEGSDIDFYAVGQVSRDDEKALNDAYPGVSIDVIKRTREEYRAKLESGDLCLEHNVVRSGVLIAGEERATYGRADAGKPWVNRAAVAGHIETACQKFNVQLDATARVASRRGQTLPPSHAALVAASADAAERVAKAMLVLVGVLPRKTHFVPVLRDQMLDQAHVRRTVRTVANLPDNVELARRIIRMDGETQTDKLHIVEYLEGGVFPYDPAGKELIRNAHARLYASLDNVLWLYDLIVADPEFETVAARARVELATVIGTAVPNASPEHYAAAASKTIGGIVDYEVQFGLPGRNKTPFYRIAEIASQ